MSDESPAAVTAAQNRLGDNAAVATYERSDGKTAASPWWRRLFAKRQGGVDVGAVATRHLLLEAS